MDSSGALTRAVAEFGRRHLGGGSDVCVGLSGGADSLALTASAVRVGMTVEALIVDHGLQPGSADVAAEAARTARGLGASARILRVEVGSAGGLEAAARDARYSALDAARGDRPVLLGHTADDQAETVLLGLARGSGARSIAGMRAWRAPWGRPLLAIRRVQTESCCAAMNLTPHADPHNVESRFTRVRVRTEVLPLLDDVLHGGVVDALCRTASSITDDADLLDALADDAYCAAMGERDGIESSGGEGLPLEKVGRLHPALRRRVIRRWLLEVGATEPTSRVIHAVDALAIAPGRGQVAIGGDEHRRIVVERQDDHLRVSSTPR